MDRYQQQERGASAESVICVQVKCQFPSAGLRQEGRTGAGFSFIEQSSLQSPAAAKSLALLVAAWGTLLFQLPGS